MKKLKLWIAIIFLSIPVLAWAVAYKGSTLESTGNTAVGGNLYVTGQSDFTGALHSSNTATFQTTAHLSTATFVSGIHGSGSTYLADLYLGGTHRTTWPGSLDFTAPGPIGGTTPSTGNFTTIAATTMNATNIVASNQITLGGVARTAWPAAGDTSGVLVNASDIQSLAMALQESHGIEQLLMEEGFKASFNASTTRIDTVNSSGYTFVPGGASTSATPGYIRNTAGGTGLPSNIAFTTESDYLQQEWTKTNQATSFIGSTNGSTNLTLSSGSFPANFANGRISLDGGTTWYSIGSVWGTGVALTLAYTGATGTTNDWTGRMSEFSSGTVQLNVAAGSAAADQSQLTSNSPASIGGVAGAERLAQTFTAGASGNLSQVDLKLSKSGSPTDNLQVAIYAVSANMPTGAALSSVEIKAGGTLTTTPTVYSFTFSSPASVTSGTVYAIVMSRSTGVDGVNYYQTDIQNNDPSAGPYANGQRDKYDGATWTLANNGYDDNYFKTYVATAVNVITEYVSTSLSYANRVDTSAWSDINSLARTETLNSQSVYYWLIDNPATSFGAGTAAKIWNATGGVWRNIARNNAGTWQYNNDATATASETWINSTVNDMLHAISKAVSSQANNRMTGAQMAGVTDGNLTSPATSQIVGVTLQSSSTSQNPSVDNIAVNYDSNSSALDLRTSSFLTSAAPSTIYGFVAVKETTGTPTYTVSCNGGSAYNAITMSEVIALADGRAVKRGTRNTSGDGCTTDIRMKVTVPAASQFEISGIGLQGRQ